VTAEFRARVAAVCARLPGAEASDPWGGGHDAWKVGGKMFACIGAVTPGASVKCADIETAAMLIDAGVGERAPYFHRSWILLPESTADDELSHRLETAYGLIRAKLPKKTQAALSKEGG
jgi:predicted DNA-binding protein (MmcQ/YjbR family)